jgi:hypothetical protein
MNNDKNTCTNCFFSGTEIISGEEAMVCKRYAPRIISGSGTGWSGQNFPVVSSNELCGEHIYANPIELVKKLEQ